jgi:hypothetical protein
MSTKTQPSTPDEPYCGECNLSFDSMDELVDHLSDEHDAFDWLVAGRPIRGDQA